MKLLTENHAHSEMYPVLYLPELPFNPSNAEARFVQRTRSQSFFEKEIS